MGIADEVNDLGVVLMFWIEKQSQEIARVY